MFTTEQLVLKNYDLDDFDESMHLEEMEVDFWNKTGYDPRKVWNGFKMTEEHKIYYEIYDNALNYLNQKMTESSKPRIKSINDNYKDGDLVLIKDGSEYHVGAYNGVYIQIVRENVQVPKCEIELELDRRREEEEKKIEELRANELTTKTDKDIYLDAQIEKRKSYFIAFKQKYGIPLTSTMEEVFTTLEKSDVAFEDFVAEQEGTVEADAVEYSDDDSFGRNEDGDGAY